MGLVFGMWKAIVSDILSDFVDRSPDELKLTRKAQNYETKICARLLCAQRLTWWPAHTANLPTQQCNN